MCGRALLAAYRSADLALATYVRTFVPDHEQGSWKASMSELTDTRNLADAWFTHIADDPQESGRIQETLDAARDGLLA